jgi:creatinine amidohydrolase/Fe(II)-dependent formamide hydrolase-like protein
MRRVLACLLLGLIAACDTPGSPPGPAPDIEWTWDKAHGTPDTVFMAEMTAGEIAARQRDGARAVIVPVGGLEQNGPHVVTGKHDLIVEEMARRVALARGDMLVARTVSFVPQGRIAPTPTGHMRMPGTISLRQETYEALLRDICESLLATGFETVVMIGDSGGNQLGMRNVAGQLEGVHAIIPYYAVDPQDRSLQAKLGIVHNDDPVHSDYRTEALLSVLNPDHIRYDRRGPSATVRGVELGELDRLTAHGEQFYAHRVALTSKAIDQALAAR